MEENKEENRELTEKQNRIKELESKIRVLEWDVKRDQINPAKKQKLEQYKTELVALKSGQAAVEAQQVEHVENPFAAGIEIYEEEEVKKTEEGSETSESSEEKSDNKEEGSEKKEEPAPEEEVTEETEMKNQN